MEYPICSIGQLTASECHKITFCQKKGIKNVNSLSEEDKGLLCLRTETKLDSIQTICFHHESLFLKKFELCHKTCSDPLKKHKGPIKKSLRPVTLQQSKCLSEKGFKVKPGEKLCPKCRELIYKSDEYLVSNIEEEYNYTGQADSGLRIEEKHNREEAIEKLNVSLNEMECSPLKLHGLGETSKRSYGKRKLEKLQKNIEDNFRKVLNVEVSPTVNETEKIVSEKAADLDKLVEVMKENIKCAPRNKQIQMLTIPAALSWPRKIIQQIFDVSDYSVRQAQNIFKEKGFLAEPDYRRGKRLSPETVDVIRNFYQSDEQSRVMPGMKDVISIGKNEYEQKRLILSNLKELYSAFKKEYPNINVGFSKFCTLRPKWCVLAGSSGTHSVCVCTIHQNVILLLYAAQINDTYKDIMKFLLCEEPTRECMLRHCPACPEKHNLIDYLKSKFEDYDENESIEFSQWVCTDRTQMIKSTATLDDFIDDLTNKIERLIPHSFIAKSQSLFLKNLKENLQLNTAIILLDFSENYAFVVQDEAQGYHWTSESCTLHSVLVHYKNSEGVKMVSSHCIISDDLKHDVSMVYKSQEKVLKFVKENSPHIEEVHYFSDGCAAQYKNKYNFLNLSHHENDFNLKAVWSFFATSHGKSECDGIGGTAKRLARKESLQRHLDNQIISPKAFFDFCVTHISSINFHFVSRDELQITRSFLEASFKDLQTLPGTRNFHNFRPLDSVGTIEARRISNDEGPAFTFNLKNIPQFPNTDNLYPGCFIACIYDDLWYFGMVSEVNQDERDVLVKFLHPSGPSPSFYWPSSDDICGIPFPHVLSVIEPPHTITGRTYVFSKECMLLVEKKMKNRQLHEKGAKKH